MFFFFFSSRRRHTRYWRDWSSDVCSSDLTPSDETNPPARTNKNNIISPVFGTTIPPVFPLPPLPPWLLVLFGVLSYGLGLLFIIFTVWWVESGKSTVNSTGAAS